MTTNTSTTDPDQIVADARQRAAETAAAFAAAGAVLTGAAPATARMKAADITPARLAELRAEAEHAALLVPAAEQRAEALRVRLLADHKAAVRDRIRAEAATDMASTSDLSKALSSVQKALDTFITTAAEHNARVVRWHDQMAEGGIPSGSTTADSPDPGLTRVGHSDQPETITLTIDGHTYQAVPTIKFLAALIHRTTRTMPLRERHYQGWELVERDWTEGGHSHHSPAYAVDLAARVRESTGAA